MMKMDNFDDVLHQPGTPDELAWIKERLETLSVREQYAFTAVAMAYPMQSLWEVAAMLHKLDEFELCFPAGSYKQLGQFYLKQQGPLPDSALPYVNLEKMGQTYEDENPGLFVGNCYVVFSKQTNAVTQENELDLLWDSDWSVKLKLASPAVPEGVWLRLPGRDGKSFQDSDEVVLALHELEAKSLEDCTLLEAQCILPEVGDLMKQYSSITDLVRDGDNLGYIMDEQGQGEDRWMGKFAAALEYEGCRTLKFALDISQNLRCYDWVSSEELEDFAANHLRDEGVSEEVLESGCIDLTEYAKDLLETSGYMEASGEIGYILRNTQEFFYEYSVPGDNNFCQQDILTAFPFLEELSSHVDPEEMDVARRSISKSLAGRGQEGLRQLQAAMEYEDCANLNEAAEIAARLDDYEFTEIGGFQETTKRELLARGLNKRVVDMCFNFESYAAISCNYEDIYSSQDTGLYVHRNNAMTQPEQGGMTMQ